jgi:hypothetical protein
VSFWSATAQPTMRPRGDVAHKAVNMVSQPCLPAVRHCNRMEAGSAEENLPTRDFWHVIMVG